MTDILSKLQPCGWRGIRFPITGVREYGFTHEQAQHRILFQDDKLIQSLGRENPGFSYTAMFLETIATERWKNLFTVVYPKFLAACKDRSEGELIDPVHGITAAKCVRLSEQLDVTVRNGVMVAVEYIETPKRNTTGKRPAEMPITALQGAVELGRRIDGEVEKIDWQQEEPPETTRDLFDSIQSFGDQAELFQSNVAGLLGNLAHRMDRSAKTIDRLKDPSLAPTRRSVRKLQLAAITLQESATRPPRPVRIVTQVADISKIAFAGAYRMTVADLHRLNPRLQAELLVSAGEPVTVFRD